MNASKKRWPRLGLGCATLGTPPPQLEDCNAIAVIDAAIERGIRFFDVAPLYGGGLAEERLGIALRLLPRDEYILCTKTGVTRPYAQSATPPGAAKRREFDRWDFSAATTRASIAASLARLCTDRLDVVHLHDAENHLDECLEAHHELERLQATGVVDAIGCGSNLTAPLRQMIERVRIETFLLAGRYTLLDTSGRELIDLAHRRGIAVVAGGVFNSGVLATWPQPAAAFDYLAATPAIVARVGRIAAICDRHRVPLAAAALQFVLANPSITTVLIGPRTLTELDLNLAAGRYPIPDALWSDLEGADLIPSGIPRPTLGATHSLFA